MTTHAQTAPESSAGASAIPPNAFTAAGTCPVTVIPRLCASSEIAFNTSG